MEAPDLRYEIIVYWSDDDGAYVAEVPELPGCVSDGASHGEAVANVLDASRAWIETAREQGRAIPVPKGRRLMFA